MPPTLDVPPFPPLTFGDYAWSGSILLRTWTGFQTRRGPYASVSAAEVSDGTVELRVHCDGADPVPPSAEQVAAFAYLLQSEKLVTDSVLTAIFERYPQFREEALGSYAENEEYLAPFPEIARPDQLRPLIGLSIIHVLRDANEGRSYVGFEFGCVWEEEHGLGVMTHGDRVLEVGAADSSFLPPS
jgi:hypothetical protein